MIDLTELPAEDEPLINASEPASEPEPEIDAPEEAPSDPVSDTRADIESAIEKLAKGPDDAAAAENQPEETAEKPEAKRETAPDADTKATQDAPAKAKGAPVGWKGDAAKAWETLPEAVQAQVAQRERDIAVTMQQTAGERRLAKNFADAMTNYREPLQQLGFSDPLTAVKGVMDGVLAMRSGTASERARAAASMLTSMQIDIKELDNALVAGGATQQPQQNIELEAMLDRRLAPVTNFMSQLEQQQYTAQQQATQQSVTEVGDFLNSHEYGDQVRNDMADLLDMAAARGQQMTLQQAYDKACVLHPEIAGKVDEARRQKQQEKTRESAEAKRHASSSVSGQPAGNGSNKKQPQSIADALNQAWDMHSTGRR